MFFKLCQILSYQNTLQYCNCIKKNSYKCENISKYQVNRLTLGKTQTLHCCGVHLRQICKKPVLSVMIKRNNNNLVQYTSVFIRYDTSEIKPNYLSLPFICNAILQKVNTIFQNLFQNSFENKFNSSTCCICLEDVDRFDFTIRYKRLSCSHFFHHKFIMKWFEKKKNCPLCKSIQ